MCERETAKRTDKKKIYTSESSLVQKVGLSSIEKKTLRIFKLFLTSSGHMNVEKKKNRTETKVDIYILLS